MNPEIRILTVDAAGTLIKPWPSVGAVYAKTAREFGFQVDDELIDDRFYEIFGLAQKNKKITVGEEEDFWRSVVHEVFRPFGPPKELESVFERLWNLFARGDHWRIAENAEATLKTLREKGYRIALLSNNDSRLRKVIEDLGVSDLFEHIFISSEIGSEKPELKIFRYVESEMAAKPEEFLHLGDSHSRDFEGAKAAGWSALLFGKPKIEDFQIFDFQELFQYLK